MNDPQQHPTAQPTTEERVTLPGLAAQEARQVLIFTGDFLTTVVALLSSALSLVAALAWNDFVHTWLPTVDFLSIHDAVTKELLYALVVTGIAVASVTVLTRIRKRIKGNNVFTQ